MSLVKVRNARKKFGALTVLDDVSIEIEEGETVAVIGRSGSGKSTLLRCINALESLDSGEIWVDGVLVNSPTTDVRKLREKIGIVFQSYNLFPHLTVERNITLAPMIVKHIGMAQAQKIALEVLRRVGLEEKLHSYPDQLSGGQQQRVAIARSLAMSPKIILLDEITSALDPELTGEVLRALEALASQGMTMLLVTHAMAFARNVADRVVFMNQGRVWEQGPPAEILASPRTAELGAFMRSVLS
jgi:polar amino acid transport system ATP-binding protein